MHQCSTSVKNLFTWRTELPRLSKSSTTLSKLPMHNPISSRWGNTFKSFNILNTSASWANIEIRNSFFKFVNSLLRRGARNCRVTVYASNSTRLTKRSTFQQFRTLLGQNTPTLSTSTSRNTSLIYRDGKAAATDYMQVKRFRCSRNKTFRWLNSVTGWVWLLAGKLRRLHINAIIIWYVIQHMQTHCIIIRDMW